MIKDLVGYDNKYWEYQINVGSSKVHTAIVKSRFQKYINIDDVVLDFGCGGGYILSSIDCKEKFGIEINPHASKVAHQNGISVHVNFNHFENEKFDIIFSNSALEHVPDPVTILRECYRVLKKDGKIIFSVPHEELSYLYKKGDINQHLYTWSPMAIGNLFNYSGFEISEIKVIKEKQPPFYEFFYSIIGLHGLSYISKMYRLLRYFISDTFKTIAVSADIVVIAKK